MYLCEECGEIFEETKQDIYAYHFEVEGNKIEYAYVCPYCGSENYISVIKCDECGIDINEELDTLFVKFDNGDIICNDCLHDYCNRKYSSHCLIVR